jgi:hypothetical protein
VTDIPAAEGGAVDAAEPILFDGCERCAEQAADPLTTLDLEHQQALWRVMLEVEHSRPLLRRVNSKALDDVPERGYLTHAERQACRVLYHVAIFLDHHGVLKWGMPLVPMVPKSAFDALTAEGAPVHYERP